MENFKKALSELEKNISENPNAAEKYYQRAEFILDFLLEDEFDSIQDFNRFCRLAINDLDTAITLKPDYVDAYCKRAIFHYYRGKEKKADEDLTYAYNLDKSHSETNFLVGVKNYMLEVYKDAIKYLNISIGINSNNGFAYLFRAQAHGMLNDIELMNKDFDQALSLLKNTEEVYKVRGDFFIEIKRFDEALADLNKVIDLEKTATSYNKRAEIYMKIGEYEKALIDYQQVINIEQETGDNLLTHEVEETTKKINKILKRNLSFWDKLKGWFWFSS